MQVCVIIPTYNNATTLKNIIEDVSDYTNNIIVINDGSTDETELILEKFPSLQIISYEKNVGKGWALRMAFVYARKLNYKYAISIDSDGQHFAKDLPGFINQLSIEPHSIIMGARNMNQDTIPGGSSFGNNFSNFWFKLETGIKLPDTQTGFRLYPLDLIKDFRFYTKKYEFEIEVLVRSSWKGIKIVSVPISVYYAPKEQRISHFRPYKDFIRISLLNTILVLLTFLYIRPRNVLNSLSKKKTFSSFLEQLFDIQHSNELKAISVSVGVFMGIIPIWGFQLVIAIFLAILFKLNKALVIIAANISIPPMIPLIIFLSYKIGAIWMGEKALHIEYSRNISLESIRQNIEQYVYGSITLAIILGVLFGLLTYVILKFSKRNKLVAK
ncbi:MAG: DUF2062 domain-containing protein [Bacteroidetes bacterium]|nr:DUF2062 domain-containing protein [Bacteroidota bacterium]